MAANLTAAIANNSTVGWQPGCNFRGTWDIIWSCTQTVGLCAWVSVCANCPAPQNGDWDLVTDKFFFLLMTLLGPEFVVLLAFGQYLAARESIPQFEKLGYYEHKKTGYEGWTLTHGFYANMGGIHVQPEGWRSFPVNAKQLAWLIRHGYLDTCRDPDVTDCIRKISARNIEARGKIDGLAKFITVLQALNFFVTTIARFITGLHVTTLEMTVLANIFCSLIVYICWWHKPMDLEVGHEPFPLTKSMNEILTEECPIDCGNHEVPCDYYHNTPLDFVSRDEWSASLHWKYYVNILRYLALLRFFNLHYDRPAQRIDTFNFPRLPHRRAIVLMGVMSLCYTSWFLGAWNFYFPTTYERYIWRAVTTTQASLCLTATVWNTFWEKPSRHAPASKQSHSALTPLNPNQAPLAASAYSEKHTVKSSSWNLPLRLRILWNKPISNETGYFPSLSIPLGPLMINTPICATYCICRWFILTEDVVALRSLPASAYVEVNWAPYWPWF